MLGINILLSKQNQLIYLIVVVSLLVVGLGVSFFLMNAVKKIKTESVLQPIMKDN